MFSFAAAQSVFDSICFSTCTHAGHSCWSPPTPQFRQRDDHFCSARDIAFLLLAFISFKLLHPFLTVFPCSQSALNWQAYSTLHQFGLHGKCLSTNLTQWNPSLQMASAPLFSQTHTVLIQDSETELHVVCMCFLQVLFYSCVYKFTRSTITYSSRNATFECANETNFLPYGVKHQGKLQRL